MNGTLATILRIVGGGALLAALSTAILVWADNRELVKTVADNKAEIRRAADERDSHEKEDSERFHEMEKRAIRQELLLENIARSVGAKVPPKED